MIKYLKDQWAILGMIFSSLLFISFKMIENYGAMTGAFFIHLCLVLLLSLFLMIWIAFLVTHDKAGSDYKKKYREKTLSLLGWMFFGTFLISSLYALYRTVVIAIEDPLNTWEYMLDKVNIFFANMGSIGWVNWIKEVYSDGVNLLLEYVRTDLPVVFSEIFSFLVTPPAAAVMSGFLLFV